MTNEVYGISQQQPPCPGKWCHATTLTICVTTQAWHLLDECKWYIFTWSAGSTSCSLANMHTMNRFTDQFRAGLDLVIVSAAVLCTRLCSFSCSCFGLCCLATKGIVKWLKEINISGTLLIFPLPQNLISPLELKIVGYDWLGIIDIPPLALMRRSRGSIMVHIDCQTSIYQQGVCPAELLAWSQSPLADSLNLVLPLVRLWWA